MSMGRGGTCRWCGDSWTESSWGGSYGCKCGKYRRESETTVSRPPKMRSCSGCPSMKLNLEERKPKCMECMEEAIKKGLPRTRM